MGDFILKIVAWAFVIGAVLFYFDLFFIIFTGKSMKYFGKKEDDCEEFLKRFFGKKDDDDED